MSDIVGLADRLEAIVSELDELAFDRLREAAADGERERPVTDRELVKARRSVEKALHILRGLSAAMGE